MKKEDNSETGLQEHICELALRQFELETQNKELILEKETAAKALAQQNDALSKLNRFSLELSQLSSEENPEILITKRIKEFTGGMMASFAEYNEELHTMTVKHIETEPGILEKAINFLGIDVSKMSNPVTDEMYHEMTTETIGMRKSLNEATFGSISHPAGAALQVLFKVDRFMVVAYLSEGRLFGASIIAMYKDQPDPPGDILMDFVSMASLSLRRNRADEIIKLKNEELIRVNAEKDKFFSIIAHDLRSPFNAFLGFTELMVAELDSLSITEIQKIALSMRNSATNLFQLLENLLEWSRFQRGLTGFNPKSILLLPGITDSIQSVFESAVKKEIDIKVDIPNDLVVFADENMLGSIVRNLAFNAVKFTLKGGKINISARAVLPDFAEISVKDSGIGMSEDIQETLFSIKEHSTRSGTDGEPSTGLGLIICKEFVEEHGGKIWGNSQNGKGSEFKFTLPLFIGQINQPVNN